MNVQMQKHWGEVIAELFQQHTVFDIGIDQFKYVGGIGCNVILVHCKCV